MDEGSDGRDFASGFGAIDAEHRVQMGLVVALADAIRQGRRKSEQDALIDHLVTYTQVHFSAEQLLMRQYAYPAYRAHALEHDELLDRIDTLRATYDAGNEAAILRAIGELQAWLLGHIHGSDDRLGHYLSEHAPAGSD